MIPSSAQQIQTNIVSLIVDKLISEKERHECFLISLSEKLTLLDEAQKNDLVQSLSADKGPFDRSTPDTLAALFDFCQSITQAPEVDPSPKSAAIFLITVLSTHPKVLKKRLELQLENMLISVRRNDVDTSLSEDLQVLNHLLIFFHHHLVPDKITTELFQFLCQRSDKFNMLLRLHKRLENDRSQAGQWIYENTTKEKLGQYTFSAKKTRFDERLPDVITLLVYQKMFASDVRFNGFYQVYAQTDLFPTIKMMRLARIAHKHTNIIQSYELRSEYIDLSIRRQAVWYIFDILLLRSANRDYSRLLNPIKKANMNCPAVTIVLNQIETNLISYKMSVAVVMRTTVMSLLFALLEDARHLLVGWSETPSLSDIMLTLMQFLLTDQYCLVLRYIHTQMTTHLPVAFGEQARIHAADIEKVIQETIRAIDYRAQEGHILYAIENNFEAILQDMGSITIFLQQIVNIRFDTRYSEGLWLKINTAAENYIQKKIFSLNTKTSNLCKKLYAKNETSNALEKLQDMGSIAFKRAEKNPKSRYHDLYQEIATFRRQDLDDLDRSNHSVSLYSEDSRPTYFAASRRSSLCSDSSYLTNK